MTYSFELGPIRPPNEAYSLLIRATINCPWNRCRFCPTYKGAKFRLRSVEEIKQDIETAAVIRDKILEASAQSGPGTTLRDMAIMVLNAPPNEAFRNVALWLYSGGENVFLQDANSLIMRTNELVEALNFLKTTFPDIKRITSYARSNTVTKKSLEELREVHQTGLSRLHIGLESGYDPLLQYMDKGVTAAEHIAGGRKVKESGISLSEYVILGLGGKTMWREHALETARVLNEIDPDFIRVRTLAIKEGMPLYKEVANGNFVRANDEEIVAEERLLIENLQCQANYVSDHITNLLQELEGNLPEDKKKFLEIIDRFQALSPEERANFKIGRRVRIYGQLDDLDNPRKRQLVARLTDRLGRNGHQVDDDAIFTLMAGFV
ncbi:MAG: radical SAM protein [Dehalococcoidales bacterium]|nr:radical SAM protein [Dehalococcoidales bacterium]